MESHMREVESCPGVAGARKFCIYDARKCTRLFTNVQDAQKRNRCPQARAHRSRYGLSALELVRAADSRRLQDAANSSHLNSQPWPSISASSSSPNAPATSHLRLLLPQGISNISLTLWWDPFEGFPFSGTVFNIPTSVDETAAFASTRIDWKETTKSHVFKVDLTRIKKEEVKVEVEEGRVLQINGERNIDQEEKNDKWHRMERSNGKFLRRFRLPENTKMEDIKATMENGVLTVTIPKIEVNKPELKAIDISG
nr:18.1 kDa class I heat shock protein-like [Nicotiana tomentosiformis]